MISKELNASQSQFVQDLRAHTIIAIESITGFGAGFGFRDLFIATNLIFRPAKTMADTGQSPHWRRQSPSSALPGMTFPVHRCHRRRLVQT